MALHSWALAGRRDGMMERLVRVTSQETKKQQVGSVGWVFQMYVDGIEHVEVGLSLFALRLVRWEDKSARERAFGVTKAVGEQR